MGTSIVFVPVPGARLTRIVCVCGFWLGEKPVIELSFRYKTNDHVWFNFFHELGHILLHSPRQTWIDDFTDDLEILEREANTFAANTLIPPDEYARLLESEFRAEAIIRRFAKSIRIAPGIVVGRLQRDKHIPPENLYDVKQPIEPSSPE